MPNDDRSHHTVWKWFGPNAGKTDGRIISSILLYIYRMCIFLLVLKQNTWASAIFLHVLLIRWIRVSDGLCSLFFHQSGTLVFSVKSGKMIATDVVRDKKGRISSSQQVIITNKAIIYTHFRFEIQKNPKPMCNIFLSTTITTLSWDLLLNAKWNW